MHRLFVLLTLLAGPSLGLKVLGYDKYDQYRWAETYKSCGGKMQSPISISSFRSVPLPLPALETVGFHNPLPVNITVKNYGLSVAITFKKNPMVQTVPYIFGAALGENREFRADHLHFHWGKKNNRGSEHVLNGVRFPLEMHVVHVNKAYKSVQDALKFQDGLVVLAIFFQLQEEDNQALLPILDDVSKAESRNEETTLNSTVTLSSLLPSDTDLFYTYKGSLTTPPCSEVVTWIVFPKTVAISFRQLKTFRSLSRGGDIHGDNFRKLQDVGLRKVFVRRANQFVTNFQTFNLTELSWFWK